MIALHAVSKSFAPGSAVGPIDLEPGAGRTTVLIGPSGCGKSTLLRLMLGLLRPDSGTVRVEGAEVADQDWPAVRRRLGYVIQEGGLFPHLTARENVTLMAQHLGWEGKRVAGRVRELADLVRLPEAALERHPVELSGGERQRVALIRALFLDPGALLLDEPLGSLDPLIRADLQEDLRAVFRGLRKTVVLVTHDLAEAGFFGDEVVLLRAGRVVQRGPFADLLRRPAEPFVERFVRAQRPAP